MADADDKNDRKPDEQEAIPTADYGGAALGPGAQIGPYKLLSILGEGGYGIVYLAERERPVRRRVALKVIKPGMDTKEVIARFEAERQALALLDHANIAQVYNAGTTEAGHPYFVMEHVKGLPITEHCDREKLGIEDRLELFRHVCEGVQHAHEKGIIHRDIKPSNILVYMEGNKAIPKIIDFGVAKAMSQPLTGRTLYTETGQFIGTPEYMSPEQAEMAAQDIDTRSDVYSLGAVLYELLTGTLPFDSEVLRSGGVDHIRRVIREEEPKTPSTRLTSLGEQAVRIAEHRRVEVGTLAKRLHKELEWIPLKAMRKERAERYRSASELADDIGNYSNGAPLMAGPLGTGYKLKKFVRRNRLLVGAVATALVMLSAGVVVSTIFALGQARALADNRLITDFLQKDVLGSAYEAKAGEATVSFILDAASTKLPMRFKGKPLIEASIRRTLAETYWQLGESEKAEEHFSHAIQICREHLGDEHVDTLGTEDTLGYVYLQQGRYRDAQRLWTRILAIQQRTSRVLDQIPTRNGLGAAYSCLGKYEEAAQVLEVALESEEAWHEQGTNGFDMFPYVKGNLACVYMAQGRYEAAERLFAQTRDVKRNVTRVYAGKGRYEEAERRFAQTPDNEWPAVYPHELGDLYRQQGRYDEAESVLTTELERLRQLLGDTHSGTLNCVYPLVRLYVDRDRREDAETLFEEALPVAHQRLRKGHPDTLGLVNACAVLRTKQKQYEEAEILFEEALTGRQRELGDDHPDTLETVNDLGVLRREQGQYVQAESLLTKALEARRTKLGPDHPACLESKHELALLCAAQENYDEAEPLLLEAFHGRETRLGAEHPYTIESLRELVHLYESWDKPNEAATWRAKLPRRDGTEEQD